MNREKPSYDELMDAFLSEEKRYSILSKLYEQLKKDNQDLVKKYAELEEEKDELEYENDYLKEDLENNTAFVDNLRENIIKKYGDDAYNDLIYDRE